MPVKVCVQCQNEVWCDCYSDTCEICKPPIPPYSERMHKAFEAVSLIHKGQERKNPPGVPFVSHCFAVYDLVKQYTRDEDTLIAALLHDAIEDNDEIGKETVLGFGEAVYTYVLFVTEPRTRMDGTKIKWRERKSLYAIQLEDAPEAAKMISCADKIHNINSLLIAKKSGIDIWGLMTTNGADQIDRYTELLNALSNNWRHPLLKQFKRDLDLLAMCV